MTNLIINTESNFIGANETFVFPIESILFSRLDAEAFAIYLYTVNTTYNFVNFENPPTADYLRTALNSAFAANPGQGDINLADLLPADFLIDLIIGE